MLQEISEDGIDLSKWKTAKHYIPTCRDWVYPHQNIHPARVIKREGNIRIHVPDKYSNLPLLPLQTVSIMPYQVSIKGSKLSEVPMWR